MDLYFTKLDEFVSHMPKLNDAEVAAHRDSLVGEIKIQLQPAIHWIIPTLSCYAEIRDLQCNWNRKTPAERFEQFHLIIEYEAEKSRDPNIRTMLRRLAVFVLFTEADTKTLRATGHQLVRWFKVPEEYQKHRLKEAAMSGIYRGLERAYVVLSGPFLG